MSKFDSCLVCGNQANVKAKSTTFSSYCLFCRSEFASSPQSSLDQITGYKILRTVDLKAPAKVYEAMQDDARFFITLLSEESHIYSALANFADMGNVDPYRSLQLAAHPNLIRTYPVQWRGKVAIAMMDPLEGQLLADLLLKIGPVDVADAVNIVLQWLTLSKPRVWTKQKSVGIVRPVFGRTNARRSCLASGRASWGLATLSLDS